MNDFTMRSDNEAETLQLLYDYNQQSDTSDSFVIASVFVACWAQSLTLDKICAIAGALNSMIINREAMEVELAKMVKAKVLRKRRAQGKVFWEVNY